MGLLVSGEQPSVKTMFVSKAALVLQSLEGSGDKVSAAYLLIGAGCNQLLKTTLY